MEYSTPVLTLMLVTFVTALVYYIRRLNKVRNYWKERGVPHEKSLNFISNLILFFSTSFHEMLLGNYKKHGRIYGTYEFRQPVLTVCEPDLLRGILVKDFHAFTYRRDFDYGHPVIQKMVAFLKGKDWERVRTIITPAFTSRKMGQMSDIINGCSKAVIDTFDKHFEKGEPVDCKGIFGAFTLDVIANAAFGTKIDSHKDPENIFAKHARGFSAPSVLRCISICFLPNWFNRIFGVSVFSETDFFRNVVLKEVKERRETGKKCNDILQLFIDAQNEVENETSEGSVNSDAQGDENDRFGKIVWNEVMPRIKNQKLHEDELAAQCILFFLVGYETTASTLSFIAYNLALNPKCQGKLIAEVDEVSKEHEELNYDIIRDMKYLDCVVSETLRIHPPLIRGERTACEDYKLGDTGITIEKGNLVLFNVHAMHLDPEFFQNPEEFDPERFMSENANHPQYAYLPFGAGPRNCLGMRFALMEIKLCICNILRYYRFKKAETTKVPLEYKRSQGFLSVNDLPLKLERRNT